MWYGTKAKNTLKSKSRLLAEKINKNERKNKSEIITETMGVESKDFWLCLGADGPRKVIVSIAFFFLLRCTLFLFENFYRNRNM